MRIKLLFLIFISCFLNLSSQIKDKTVVRGFIDIGSSYDIDNDKLSFQFGEQDLFITSDLTDKVSFLGESVLKYSPTSPTKFDVSLERAIFKYNYFKNHNFFAGKVHTALNYWNDTYHHGRLFFPTVGRPEMFNQNIIPLHTTGFGLSGQNLGNLKFGYTLMAGNGLGSTDIADDNQFKAYVAAINFKPIEGLRVGLSGYYDQINGTVHLHSTPTGTVTHVHGNVKQQIYSASLAYFKKNVEFLAEGSLAINHTDSLGDKTTNAYYIYGGYRIKDILIPYVRYDYVWYTKGEMFYSTPNNTEAIAGGLRYEMNYLTSIKLEYQYKRSFTTKYLYTNNVFLQIAIGF
jgi:hypothetical protein